MKKRKKEEEKLFVISRLRDYKLCARNLPSLQIILGDQRTSLRSPVRTYDALE